MNPLNSLAFSERIEHSERLNVRVWLRKVEKYQAINIPTENVQFAGTGMLSLDPEIIVGYHGKDCTLIVVNNTPFLSKSGDIIAREHAINIYIYDIIVAVSSGAVMRFLIKILRNIETRNISDNATAHATVATRNSFFYDTTNYPSDLVLCKLLLVK